MIPQRKGDPVAFSADEFIKAGTTLESISGLRPAFAKDGSVTAANASGINDGAAGVVVMSAERAAKLGLKPLATIKAYASSGVDPSIMGMGPVPASRRCLEKAGWKASDLDLMEINEAFAAQACAVNKEMGWDTSKINVNGGAIALGHPIGASGCRVLVTLLYENGAPGREEGPRLAVHRRWHGRCAGRGALAIPRRDVPQASELYRAEGGGLCEQSRTPSIVALRRRLAMTQEKHRVALVTGGMGGLGEAICVKLAALGYTVVTTHSPGNAKAPEWLESMQKSGYKFHAYPCDVVDRDSCVACVAKVAKEVGPVDVLVNNAGITRRHDLQEKWTRRTGTR